MASIDAPVLSIVCPRHTDENGLIERATLNTSEDGRKRMVLEKSAPRELLQGVPLDAHPARVLDLTPGDVEVYGAESGVEPGRGRWRLILECPRPSCNYRVERLLHPYREHLETLLAAMDSAGESSWAFTDVNREPWQWRRVVPTNGHA